MFYLIVVNFKRIIEFIEKIFANLYRRNLDPKRV